MRKFSAACGMLLLSLTVWGCADPTDQSSLRSNNPGPAPVSNNNGTQQPGVNQSLTVSGTIQGSEKGNSDVGLAGSDILDKAVKLIISALDPTGKLIPIGEGKILPGGKYEATIDAKDPVGIYVLSVLDIGNAVIGSAVLNGIPAFTKGFLVDIPIDTLTSFKTEVLMVLASGGTPGVQNYLNVINTFLDNELAGWLVVGSAFVSDFNAIVGSVAKSVIAAQDVMFSLLEKAGFPVDLSKISQAELAAVNGFTGFVTNLNGQVFTQTKNLLMALEEMASRGAAPIDKLLFNAVVGGGAMFNSTLKGLLPAQMGGGFGTDNTNGLTFSIFKSAFKLEAMASLETIDTLFTKGGVDPTIADAVKNAGAMFMTNIQQAKDMNALNAAKAAYTDMLLGKQATPKGNIIQMFADSVVATLQQVLAAVTGQMAPVSKELATNLNAPALTGQMVSDALTKFDTGTQNVATDLKKALSANDAEAMADALKATAKVFLP